MLFTLDELTRWLGVTVFEVWVWLLSLMATLTLVTLRLEGVLSPSSLSWWAVLSPLFVADALNAYFCVIVLLRLHLEGQLRPAAKKALWSISVLTLVFSFEFLLGRKLTDPSALEYSAVMSPVFILLQLIMIRACHLPA